MAVTVPDQATARRRREMMFRRPVPRRCSAPSKKN